MKNSNFSEKSKVVVPKNPRVIVTQSKVEPSKSSASEQPKVVTPIVSKNDTKGKGHCDRVKQVPYSVCFEKDVMVKGHTELNTAHIKDLKVDNFELGELDGLTVRGDICVLETSEVLIDSLPLPLQDLPLGYVTAPISFNGITITPDSLQQWRLSKLASNNATDLPNQRYLPDTPGTTVLFCGLPNEYIPPPGQNLRDDVPLLNRQTSSLTFSVSGLPEGQAYAFDFKFRYSTEPGYDFLIVGNNATEEITRYSGAAPGTQNPPPAEVYLASEQTIILSNGQSVTILYSKDNIWRAGVDMVYIFIENARQVIPAAGGNLCVQGDLTVDGSIINYQNDLNQVYPVPVSQEIFDMHKLWTYNTNNYVMEVEEDQIIPILPPLTGGNSPVYGYNEDGSLNFTGGKIYNDFFTEFKIKYHAPDPSTTIWANIDTFKPFMSDVTNYYAQRGFSIPYKDTNEVNENMFAFVGSGFQLGIEFVTNATKTPVFVDLVFGNYLAGYAGITGYKDDIDVPSLGDNRNPRYGYPTRIPVTSNVDLYRANPNGLVFYNPRTRLLFFDLKNIDKYSYYNANFPFVIPGENGLLAVFMKSFRAVLAPLSRNRRNELVISNVQDAELLVQVSQTVEAFNYINFNSTANIPNGITINYNTNNTFNGVTMPRMNGGSPNFDVHIIQPGIYNATAAPNNPYVYVKTIEIVDGVEVVFAPGDNANTDIVEHYGMPSCINMFDINWTDINFLTYMGLDFVTNFPIPEGMGRVPPPLPVTAAQAMRDIYAHEFAHSTQQSNGNVRMIDQEGNATSFETLPAINNGVLVSGRSNTFSIYFLSAVRGVLSLGEDSANVYGVPSYGTAMWYNYLYNQYDHNQQAFRRSVDILANIYTPLILAYNAANFFQAQTAGATYGGAYRLCLKQAFQEILNLDISDFFRDYAISLALMRNNASIPQLYRATFPWWVNSTYYPYASQAVQVTQAVYTHWWSELDTNLVPSPAATTAARSIFGANVPVTWQSYYNNIVGAGTRRRFYDDLTTFVDVIDRGIKTIDVTVAEGTFSVALVQFTPAENSNPDKSGTFIIDGPYPLDNITNPTHTFSLSQFLPQSGPIKLVASNLKVTDWGVKFGNPIYNFSVHLPEGADRVSGILDLTTAV